MTGSRFSRSFISIVLISISLLISLSSCERMRYRYRTVQGGIWNTLYNITYNSPRDLSDSILSVMKQVEMSLSPFCESSLISKINRCDTAVVVDSLLRRIFLASTEVNRISSGAFDPTVAPLVNLWGFGYKTTGEEPSPEAIDSILPYVGIGDCHIDASGHIVKKSPMTEFNFSAITKGYGCDLIAEMLRRNGCEDYLVEIGGEIAAAGRNSRGEKWHIMIDAPLSNDTAVVHERMAVIEITDAGVATSGNYRNFRTSESGSSWHTISPSTGRPAETDLLSATVVAPSAMMADAYATACMAMNLRQALEMIESLEEVEALFVTLNPADSSFVITSSGSFPKISR